jgi:hypothetical protein
MAATIAKISVRLPRNTSLGFGYRLDNDLCRFDQVIEAPAGDGIAASAVAFAAFTSKRGSRRPCWRSIMKKRGAMMRKLREIAYRPDPVAGSPEPAIRRLDFVPKSLNAYERPRGIQPQSLFAVPLVELIGWMQDCWL